jgi:hypothetical protein
MMRCYERSRQLIENKDQLFSQGLESRQLTETMGVKAIKAVNMLKIRTLLIRTTSNLWIPAYAGMTWRRAVTLAGTHPSQSALIECSERSQEVIENKGQYFSHSDQSQ